MPMPESVSLGGTPHQPDERVPTSVVLKRLWLEAPSSHVTLGWLMDHLHARSFGIVLLLLGVCGLVPVVSPVAGLLLSIPAYQMIRAHPTPIFPRRLAERPVATAKLAAVLVRVVPALRFLERFVRPRWQTPFEATKRIVGLLVLLLGLGLLVPIPLSNVPVGVAIILMAFAYLEEDGVLLAVAVVLAAALLVTGAVLAWGTVAGVLFLAR